MGEGEEREGGREKGGVRKEVARLRRWRTRRIDCKGSLYLFVQPFKPHHDETCGVPKLIGEVAIRFDLPGQVVGEVDTC